jgi:hypothetical protein
VSQGGSAVVLERTQLRLGVDQVSGARQPAAVGAFQVEAVGLERSGAGAVAIAVVGNDRVLEGEAAAAADEE